jgi:hypothetical protein
VAWSPAMAAAARGSWRQLRRSPWTAKWRTKCGIPRRSWVCSLRRLPLPGVAAMGGWSGIGGGELRRQIPPVSVLCRRGKRGEAAW